MKNPDTFITKDGVSDADLIRAARDMYEALDNCAGVLEHLLRLSPVHGYRRDIAAARRALSTARGEDRS
jgi:hypothetical protein